MAYHRQQGVDTAIVRIFNTYGSRMRPHDGRAIPTFLRQALADRPLTIFGDGSQTRSFCYVSDLIRGLVALAESGCHDPVNVGNPDEYTLLELAETIRELTGSRSGDRLRGAARGRPQAAQARRHAGQGAAWLAAGDFAARGPAAHDRRLRCEGSDRLSRRHGSGASNGLHRIAWIAGWLQFRLPDLRDRSRSAGGGRNRPMECVAGG